MEEEERPFYLQSEVIEKMQQHPKALFFVDYEYHNWNFCYCCIYYRVCKSKVERHQVGNSGWGIGPIEVACPKCNLRGLVHWRNVRTIIVQVGETFELVYHNPEKKLEKL